MGKDQLISAVLVSLIAGIVGWLTNRASNKANTTNVVTTSRVEMEKEAYERARKLDTDTIQRQEDEIDEVRAENKTLKESLELVQEQNRKLTFDMERMSRDNLHVQFANSQVMEENKHVLADNQRLRSELASFRKTLDTFEMRLPPMPRDPVDLIRNVNTDTDPMMREVRNDG